MTCDDFEFRLYDEDCRRALLGTAPVPADVAAHLAACSGCGRAWTEAADDTVGLARDLQVAPPATLVEDAMAAARRPAVEPRVGWHDLGAALTAGTVLLVLAGLLPGTNPLWQWAGFWTGAALGFAASIIDQNVPRCVLTLRC